MEYRESLVKRWSVDSEVGRVLRFVNPSAIPAHPLTESHAYIAPVIYRNPYTRLANSNTQCWRLVGSRKNGEENILAKERRSRWRRRKRPLLRSNHSPFNHGFTRLLYPIVTSNKACSCFYFASSRCSMHVKSITVCPISSTSSGLPEAPFEWSIAPEIATPPTAKLAPTG